MSSTSIQHTSGQRLAQDTVGLRLTRRGKVVVLMITLMAVFSVLALRSAPAASTDVVHHQRTATIIVTPGDTLWDIAEQVDPGADPRKVIADIEELNSLPDAGVLQVGEPLFVPAQPATS